MHNGHIVSLPFVRFWTLRSHDVSGLEARNRRGGKEKQEGNEGIILLFFIFLGGKEEGGGGPFFQRRRPFRACGDDDAWRNAIATSVTSPRTLRGSKIVPGTPGCAWPSDAPFLFSGLLRARPAPCVDSCYAERKSDQDSACSSSWSDGPISSSESPCR